MKMLVGAVPRTNSAYPELPFTVDEVKSIVGVVPGEMLISLTDEDNVLLSIEGNNNWGGLRAQTLLDHLPGAAILHLACHGIQDPELPLKSGFVMQDRTLTIERLMEVVLPEAFLAFLSACETAKGYKVRSRSCCQMHHLHSLNMPIQDQPDQAIHLAAMMLYAGFKSIIATLW